MTAPMTCAEAELLIGVLALGAIDPPDRHGIEGHLAGCDRCTATFAELAGIPGLLHRLDPEVASAGVPPVPSEFTARVLAAGDELARTARLRRRRVTAWVSVAAALLVLVGVGVPIVRHVERGEVSVSTAGSVVVTGTNRRTSVAASVMLVPEATGTALRLVLKGVEPGEHCQLVALDAFGHREVASTWVASYEGRATVSGSTALSQRSITALVVQTVDGRRLIRLTVPHAMSLAGG